MSGSVSKEVSVIKAIRDITEITNADTKELLTLAKQRIGNFPILKKIYDDTFLHRVVQSKKDYDNRLLSLLVIDSNAAINFFHEIEENLRILQTECVKEFSMKLQRWDTRHFESTITEIEFAADFTKKGFQIELEPPLPNGRKADFCAHKGSLKIFFEVKNIFPQEYHEYDMILDELNDRYSKLDTNFVIGFDLKKSFHRNQVPEVIKYVKRKLKSNERIYNGFPQSFVYPEKGEPIIEINVRKRLPKGEKGYISGSTFGGGIKGDWSDLRNKISSGISQLHPNYPGVLIVQSYGLSTLQHDIENALLGDLKLNRFGKPRLFRSGDNILVKDRNRRLSAVIYCEKRLQGLAYTRKRLVYHHLNPKTKLSPEIFKEENVTQFLPTKLDNGMIHWKKIDT